MCVQAVVVGEDQPRCGQDRHDAETPLPVDGRSPRLRGGGPVQGHRGEGGREGGRERGISMGGRAIK